MYIIKHTYIFKSRAFNLIIFNYHGIFTGLSFTCQLVTWLKTQEKRDTWGKMSWKFLRLSYGEELLGYSKNEKKETLVAVITVLELRWYQKRETESSLNHWVYGLTLYTCLLFLFPRKTLLVGELSLRAGLLSRGVISTEKCNSSHKRIK